MVLINICCHNSTLICVKAPFQDWFAFKAIQKKTSLRIAGRKIPEKSGKKWHGGGSAFKTAMSLTQNLAMFIFLQLNFCSSVSHESLITLQWATMKTCPRCYQSVWYSYITTIPDKVCGTKWNNPVKLDRRRKVWYLFLRFLTAIVEV